MSNTELDAQIGRGSGRIRQIDMLKGVAIVGVMVQHAFSSRFLQLSWDTLYAGQAVPIFFVLMGLNAIRSADRSGVRTLSGCYSRRYLRGRLDRLVVPLAVTWVAGLLVGVALGEAHVGPLALVGVLPIAHAPGNYFVTILLEFALVFPAAYVCFTRAPAATTVVIIIADVGFELLAPHIAALRPTGIAHGYLYEAAILKYGAAIFAGMWLARVDVTGPAATALSVLAAAGVLYLVELHQSPARFHWLMNSFSRSTSFISVFFAVWLVWAALRLPAPPGRGGPYRLLERLGLASYHIFLVQMIWFGALTTRWWPVAIAGMAACSLIGYGFYATLDRGASRRGAAASAPAPSSPSPGS
jgi:peptidoglycan/LPS O-acetylase OafA/YrhL